MRYQIPFLYPYARRAKTTGNVPGKVVFSITKPSAIVIKKSKYMFGATTMLLNNYFTNNSMKKSP